MGKIDLNFTMDYCRRWGLQEAVREVVQNARDVEILGGRMEVEHDARAETLTVTSHGQHLTSRALVFGATDKGRDDRTIGQFGDGLKVALGVFLRYGARVRIDTGREVWTPCVVDRDGVQVVGVSTRALPAARHRDRVVFEVGGVTAADWAAWKRGFLFLTPPRDAVQTAIGTLVRDQDRRGEVYCKGILVCRIPALRYAYDIPSLSLNRDRQVADAYEVQAYAREVWADATRRGSVQAADLYAVLADPAQEDVRVGSTSVGSFSTETLSALVATFRAAHGDAVPVRSAAEAAEAGQCGLAAVVVPDALRVVLERGGVAGLAARKTSLREDVRERFADADLTPRELDRLQGAVSLLDAALAARGEAPATVEVVDFTDESILGLYVPASDRILLARRTLSSHAAYGILAHEAAHRHGGDGDPAHRLAIEDVMARMVAGLVGGA
jgi:hypothetical protein